MGRATPSFKLVACMAAVGIVASGLAGCLVPEAGTFLGHERKKRILYDVIRGVQCEIRRAVKRQVDADRPKGDQYGENGKRKLQWFEKWVAMINLTLRIDDDLTFNPGVTLNTPNWIDAHVRRADNSLRNVTQTYSFGIGGRFSYDAGRLDIVEYAYDFHQFLDQKAQDDLNRECYTIAGVTIEANLKIDPWLDDVLEPIKKCAFLGLPPRDDEEALMPFSSEKVALSPLCRDTEFPIDPIKVISHQIEFILTFDVNATPTWNLVRVSSGGGGAKLFDASRKDTSRLLISFGPPAGISGLAKVGVPRGSKKETPVPTVAISPEMLFQHNSLLTGASVGDQLLLPR